MKEYSPSIPRRQNGKAGDYDYAGRMDLNKLDRDADLFVGDKVPSITFAGRRGS